MPKTGVRRTRHHDTAASNEAEGYRNEAGKRSTVTDPHFNLAAYTDLLTNFDMTFSLN